MKREFLEELGLEQEVIDKIIAEYGKGVQMQQAKTAKVEAERDSYKTRLEATEASLKEFEGINVDELKAKTETLSQTLEAQKAEHEISMNKLQKDWAAEKYFDDYKFTSDLAKAAAIQQFKEMDLKLEDGKFLGADDFMKELREKNPTAFSNEEDENKPIVTRPTGPKPDKKKMSLLEAMAYANEHPEADIDNLF